MSKKKYKNAAEKQKAWRIRHGQPRKVSIELRRGEELGASETTFRLRKEGESWEEYGKYVEESVSAARKRQASAKGGGAVPTPVKPGGDTRGTAVYPGDYHEMRCVVEKPIKRRRAKKSKREEFEY